MPRTADRRAALARLATAAGLAVAGGSLGGCAFPRRMTIPLQRLDDPAPGEARGLLVMLPGAYDTPRDLQAQGFVEAVRRRGLPLDVSLVDAHVGYYTNRTVIERLRSDVLEPAAARGCPEVWLAGISIGGFGALISAHAQAQAQDQAQHPGAPPVPPIGGLLLLAPYLGPRKLVAEIAAAGGLRAWDGRSGDSDEPERALWRWLKRLDAGEAGSRGPAIHLGYGRDDRFATGHRMLGEVLPPGRVVAVDGGHDWAPWRAAWGPLLDAAALPRRG